MSSLNPHNEYPALPEQATGITPDAGCSACPLANAAGHKSCNTFKLQNVPAVADVNRFNLKTEGRELQAAISRRAFDVDGIVGGQNGAYTDFWYYHNARKAINYTYFSSWYVTTVNGDTITLTLPNPEDPDADAKFILHATWRGTVEPFGWYVNGYQDYTALQPGDMVQFQYPSIASVKLQAKIIKIEEATQTYIKVKLDKNVSSCTNYFPVPDPSNPEEDLPDPEHPTVKVYHYGREAEQWMFLNEPRYLYGARKQKQIALADVPTDGIWILEEAIIAPPDNPLDPLTPYYVIEGHNGTEWVTIGEESARLHIKPGYAAYSLKTTLPEGSIRSALSTDLTATYSNFRVTYYVETTQDDSACRIVGMTCFHHRKDNTGSIANYGTTRGVIGNEYCSERIWEDYHPVDEYDRSVNPPVSGTDGIPERVTITLHHPTGLDNFPTAQNKTCIQYGFCDKYENALYKLGDRNAGFNIDYTLQFLRELWFACHKRRIQKYILSTGYDVETIMHPSIAWLNGYYAGLNTPHAWKPQIAFRGDNTWFPVKPLEITDSNDNISFINPTGFERAFVYEYDPETMTGSVDHNRVGNLPANVTGFKTKRNVFTPGATVSEDLFEWIGCQIERDSGQIEDSRGLHQISYALGQESILAPNFDVTSYDLQRTSRSTFKRDQVTGDAVITILPYRQDDKSERNIGSRTIHKVTSKGNRRYEIEFENETRTFSRFDLGTDEIGDSYNKMFSVMAGGVPPIYPMEPQALSSYEGYKLTGSRAAGAMPMDCIDINGKRFVIETVTPHGSETEAPTWGSRIIAFSGDIGGFFEVPVGNDEDGNPLLPIEVVTVKNITDTTDMVVLADPDKPELLLDQCWFDRVNRFYFNPTLNTGDYIEVKYKDSDEVEHTQYFNVQSTFTVTTLVDYSEYTGATIKNFYIGNDLATVVEGGTDEPLPGEVRFDNVDGKIHIVFNTTDSPNTWRIHLQFAVDAPEPQDDWAVGGDYLSFGKKRDIITVIADGYNGTDFFTENVVVGETATFYQSATVFIAKADTPVYYTEQGVDNWKQIPAQYITPNAASGAITIANEFFATFDPYGYGYGYGYGQYGYDMDGAGLDFWNLFQNQMCFKITDIQMVDNRGQLPHSILQKTKDTIDSMQWVLTNWGGAISEDVAMGAFAGNLYAFKPKKDEHGNDIPGCFTGEIVIEDEFQGTGYSGNKISYYWGSEAFNSGVLGANGVDISFGMDAAFGAPEIISNIPDGATIEEAYMVVGTGTITRTYSYFKRATFTCTESGIVGNDDGEFPEDDVEVRDIGFAIIGINGENDFDVLGNVAAAGEGQQVINITSLMQKMLADRNTTKYKYGYGAIILPQGVSGIGDIVGMIPSEMPEVFHASGDCFPCGDEYIMLEWSTTTIQWSGIEMGQIIMKIDYNGTDKTDIIQPRFPAMTNQLPA